MMLKNPAHLVVLLLIASLFVNVQAVAQEIRFQHVTVDAHPPQNPWVKVVADFNQDGMPDIGIGGSKGPFVWYEYPSWNKHLVTDGGYATVDGETADIDGDGDADIVLGGIVWLENPGAERVTSGSPWKRHQVAQLNSHDIEVADLDGNGKLDLVTRDQSSFGRPAGNQIQIWKQLDPDSWSRRDLVCPHGEGLKLGDVDCDGDADIIIGARWFENSGDILQGRWREHTYTAKWNHPDAKIGFGDLNSDGRPDIVLTPSELKGNTYRIAWYASPPDPHDEWEQHVIEAEQETVVHALEIADMNDDHTLDVVVAEMHQGADPDEVRVYVNDDHGLRWTRQVLSRTGSHDIVVADIGSDSDNDIIGANHGGDFQPVELWENLTR